MHPTAPTRRQLTVEAAITAAIVLLFYHPLFNVYTMMSGGDGSNLFWPIRILMQRTVFGEGVLPLWNPYSYMGSPIYASLQHSVFYPPVWLLLPLPAHVQLTYGNLLHLAITGIGTWAWLRFAHRLRGIVAVLLGASFPCVTFFWHHQDHVNQIAATAWMPLMALAVWQLLRGRLRAPTFVSLYAAMAAVQFLAGHPQEAFYTHFLSALLVTGHFLFVRRRLRHLGRIVAAAACAGFIAGLLVAVQILPMFELKSHSRRQFDDPSYPLTFSMPPDVFRTLLSPNWFGDFRNGYYMHDDAGQILMDEGGNPVWDRRAYNEYGLFVGVPVLLLFAFAPFIDRRRRRVYTVLFLIVALSFLFALGGNSDPRRLLSGDFTEFPAQGWSAYDLFLRLVPPARGFRSPARICVLSAFCLISGAGFALDAGMRRLRDRQKALAAGITAGTAVLLSLYLPSQTFKFHYPAEVPDFVWDINAREQAGSLDSRTWRLTNADADNLVLERHLESTFRYGNPIVRRFLTDQPHMNVIREHPIVDGYEEGLLPTVRFKDFTFEFNRNLRQFRPDATLLALAGVGYVYTDLPVDPQAYPLIGEDSSGWMRHAAPATRGLAFWRAATEGADLQRIDGPVMRSGQPHPGYNAEQIDLGAMPHWGDDWPGLFVSMPTTNSLLVSTNGRPDPAGALVALGWYPGWEIDGPEGAVPLRWINAINAELPLDAAQREGGVTAWHLAFRPISYRFGLLLTAIGAAIWCALTTAILRRRFHRVLNEA